MKFGLLPEKAEQIVGEYDYFSTGHYIRKIIKGDTYYLAKAKDSKKDQTYFLSRLHQHQLKKLMFPLGLYLKSEVRELALKAGFPELAARKESQDFIETDDYNFIFPDNSVKSGDIVDREGKVLGQHKGIIYYTVGQRRGLAISGLKEPLYVTGIDSANNRIIVGSKDSLYGDSLIARDVVWSDGKPRSGAFKLSAKIRLQHEDAGCEVTSIGISDYKVVFHRPQLSITPGQIIAFYDGDILLGGGFIDVL
jgi:tRNA-uridine 2-sulfurtransferase